MDRDKSLRDHLLWLLREGNAHLAFDKAIENIPVGLRGARPQTSPHTPWRLLEHMRICQWDILQFSRRPDHVSPPFPDGYWPACDGPEDENSWDLSIRSYREDLKSMMDLLADPATDLFTAIPHGNGHTILREVLLLADHNAYHLGQLVALRRSLNCWPDDP